MRFRCFKPVRYGSRTGDQRSGAVNTVGITPTLSLPEGTSSFSGVWTYPWLSCLKLTLGPGVCSAHAEGKLGMLGSYRPLEGFRPIIHEEFLKSVRIRQASFICLLIFKERGTEGGRRGEKHQCERETSVGCLLCTPGLGPEPDWELNQRPFALRNYAQPTEPHQSGQHKHLNSTVGKKLE